MTRDPQELIGGVTYRVGVMTNTKLGTVVQLRLVYCGGSYVTKYGQFGGCWASRHQDHRQVKQYWNLNIRWIEDDEA